MNVFLAVLIVLSVLIALSMGVAHLVARYAVERDEDEELLHPLSRERIVP